MTEIKKEKKIENKQKKTNIISHFLLILFLLLISFFTLPISALNSYILDENPNAKLPIASNKFFEIIGKKNNDNNLNIKTENRDVSYLIKNDEKEIDNNELIYLGSFSYTSSSFDNELSNLRFDSLSTGISYYPDINYQEVSNENLSEGLLEYFSDKNCYEEIEDYEDLKCIKSNCLSQKGIDLYYNNEIIFLPSVDGEIKSVSIAILDNYWVIGLTIKQEDEYEAFAYKYNGYSFTKLSNIPEIKSEDFADLSVGGNSDDYIVLYGAKQGIAYRIKDNTSSNISSLFDYRVMNKGFKADIIRADDGKRVDWYVSSLNCGKFTFLKLWEKNKEIVGELSFLNELILSGEKLFIYLDTYSDTERKIYLYNKDIRGDDKYYEFIDYGFKNFQEGYLYSKSFPFSSSELVDIKYLTRAGLEISSDDNYKYLITSDNSNWKEIINNSEENFELKKVSNYVLKLILEPLNDKFYSPYISKVFFDYGYIKF